MEAVTEAASEKHGIGIDRKEIAVIRTQMLLFFYKRSWVCKFFAF